MLHPGPGALGPAGQDRLDQGDHEPSPEPEPPPCHPASSPPPSAPARAARSEIMPAPGRGGPARERPGAWHHRRVRGNWAVVLAVKPPAAGKSRLRGALPGVPHETLALALALDTATAALASPEVAEVIAVTGDPGAAAALAALGARPVDEPAGGGLNPAFAWGAAAALDRPVAALQADLPALDPAELTAALRSSRDAAAPVRRRHPRHRHVLLTAPPGVPPGSPLRARLGRGARRLGRRTPGRALAHAAPRRRHGGRSGRGGRPRSGPAHRAPRGLRCWHAGHRRDL